MSGPYLMSVDLKELKRFENDLSRLKIKALPYAAKEALNAMAFETQREWRQILPQRMTLRSHYTEQSIRVDKVRTPTIDTMSSTVGSIADYMDEQEFGATERKKGKHGVPIPAAAPGRRKNRKSKVGAARRLANIELLPSVSGSRSRKIAVAMALARKRGGTSYAALPMRGKRFGIFRLNPEAKRAGIRKVWDLSKASVHIPTNPTMEPARDAVLKRKDGIWREALLKQLRFNRILGY